MEYSKIPETFDLKHKEFLGFLSMSSKISLL